ncbi:Na-translocating system protein MpsC family protein [uncultured Paenibacillus sp.]|uniref:Na-translocating system protein MpsC family protein n=1 Tax=uncultured Paenibacillus sp. TaxID=227322 RepID=UPI0015A9FDB8|nr:Na-translocating system protein MpsC family protein [uncultured Paenibacillus sp.]
MRKQVYDEIAKAYIECEVEILGVRPKETEIRLIHNHIVIIAKGLPTIDESIGPHTIRGHNLHNVLCEIERQRFEQLLIRKLTGLIGCQATWVQSDISISKDEKMEVIHFDCDIEDKLKLL